MLKLMQDVISIVRGIVTVMSVRMSVDVFPKKMHTDDRNVGPAAAAQNSPTKDK